MFHIKGQVQTSHLSNLQAYGPKYHFCDKVIPILSFYRIQNQIGSHIMFRIKGQVQTSHLSNLQAYRPKSIFRDLVTPILSSYRIQTKYFRDKVVPILPFYQIQTKIGSHIMFRIQGQVQTSHLSNLQAYSPKSHFCVKDQSNTFILPNTNPNRFTYHVSHQGTLRDK